MAKRVGVPTLRASDIGRAYGVLGKGALPILESLLFAPLVTLAGGATASGAVAGGTLARGSVAAGGAVAGSAVAAGTVDHIAFTGLPTTGDRNLALLVRGRFDSGDFAIWTGMGPVIWQGVTYLSGGNLLQVGEAGASAGGEAAGLSITLSGIDPETIAIAEAEQFQRRPVEVLLAVLDNAGQIIGTDGFFTGLADDMDSDDNPERPRVTLTCEPRSLDLSRPRPFKYLPEDQKQRFAGDTFFDMVQPLQNREDTWGR
jgi:hypothetical protein